MGTTIDRLSGAEKLSGRIDDAKRLVRWKLTSDIKMKRLAMYVGGFAEVEQEVFLSLLKDNPYEDVGFSTWVLNHFQWTIASMVRRKKLAGACDPYGTVAYIEDKSIRIERDELSEAMRAALSKIDDQRMEDMVLRNFSGENCSEIAKDYNLTRTRVRQIVKKGIERMRKPHISGSLVGHVTT